MSRRGTADPFFVCLHPGGASIQMEVLKLGNGRDKHRGARLKQRHILALFYALAAG